MIKTIRKKSMAFILALTVAISFMMTVAPLTAGAAANKLVASNTGSYDEIAGVPYYLDAGGNMVIIGFAAKGRYIAPESVTVSMVQNNRKFTDIAGHWAEEYIHFVTEREIIIGTGGGIFEGTFFPDTGMTRAMFATVIGRLYERSYGEIEMSDKHNFSDCDHDCGYDKYIDWASENGIIKGYGDGRPCLL